jgi:hypothetical protein
MKLTKSQRLTALNTILASLGGESWTQIDLSLQQFGFPTTDTWSGATEGYIAEMLKGASDADLLEFAEHFGLKLPGVSTPADQAPETPFWEGQNLRTFITHLSTGKDKAAALQKALEPYAFSSFVAHNDINPSLEWQTEIEKALATCELLVAILEPGLRESAWCDQEIGHALGRGIPVFTVRVGADPHGFVSRFQAFPGAGRTPEQIADDLFEAALIHKKLQQPILRAVVERFAQSDSFAAAKARMGMVERLKVGGGIYADRLKEAVDQNGQISNSFGVPGRVQHVLSKWG